jgi:hypothetical protein
MSVKHATPGHQQAAGWEQGVNNTSSRKPKKAVDPNSDLAKLAAKKYKDERLKVRKVLTMAVSQAHKDELSDFESQVFGEELPKDFFLQHAKLDPANYGEMAMLPPSNTDFIELEDLTPDAVDLSCLGAYDLQEITDRYNYLVDNQDSLDGDRKEELRVLHSHLEASNAVTPMSSAE